MPYQILENGLKKKQHHEPSTKGNFKHDTTNRSKRCRFCNRANADSFVFTDLENSTHHFRNRAVSQSRFAEGQSPLARSSGGPIRGGFLRRWTGLRPAFSFSPPFGACMPPKAAETVSNVHDRLCTHPLIAQPPIDCAPAHRLCTPPH